ncbi:EXONUCLEASE 1 [Salix purpurea]|uniref:Exonuclease 1 n=1 Tax=Salix purpurea TaxID=77065 RepID=A0A9Q0WQU0_SALPP|nr:EXONUCLEASE 1 [Salix purpurea]
MGIQGLLPLLKSIMVPIHIKELEGCSVAVDTYSWLHKGALSCSTQLCKGLPTSRHIEYCMHRVNLLRHYGVKPVLVFDGGLLPMKIEQENKRARTRKENLVRAIEHESNGNSAAAYECYQKAVDISPSIAHELIQVLRKENVLYVVAPYEADAQMTFLSVSKQVDAVITEDSDLIPFGCHRIIFKMDKYGQGVEFQNSRLQQNKDLSFVGFTNEMLLEMCIFSGCDYQQSLPGMGLKRAHALITKFKSYDKVIKHLRYSTMSVPPLYEESFKKAILTFRHQRVYDPTMKDIVHMSDLPDNIDNDLEFLGPYPSNRIYVTFLLFIQLFYIFLKFFGLYLNVKYIDTTTYSYRYSKRGSGSVYSNAIPDSEHLQLVAVRIDPLLRMLQGESSTSAPVANVTPRYKNSKQETGKKKLDLPVQKNLLTKYFCFASLEAKRNFKAPQLSPKSPSLVIHTSLSPSNNGSDEAASCNTSCSSASLVVSKSESNNLHSNNVESCFPDGVHEFMESPSPGVVDEKGPPESILLQNIGHSMHRPCQALLKECNNENAPISVERKTRTENKRVIVRSRFFQHKSKNKNDQDNKQEMLRVKDNDASDTNEDSILEESESRRTGNRELTTRSSFFQHKSVNENDQGNKQEKLVEKDDAANNIYKDFVLENKCSNGIMMKRKTSPDDDVQRNMEVKHMRTDASLPDNGTKLEERKLGSDISHISHYSNIAEKSIERFISVISSFKYNSSGSRASGLRAPLKDIRNTCTERSNNAVDFSQFAYIPKNQKTTAASQRR